MRRLLPALLTSACVAAVAVAAVAVAGTPHHATSTHQAARRGVVPTLPGSINVVRYQSFGGSYECDGDACGVSGSVSGNGFTLPASPLGYRSTLTVSFRYRAGGKDATFAVAAHVANSANGHVVAELPAKRSVLSTGGRAGSTTLVFRPDLLTGATTYHFEVRPFLTHHLNKARIAVTQVVFGLQAWTA
jgi:hypothetical protein